jgi:hypothetical protein
MAAAEKMAPMYLNLLLIVGVATQGPQFKKDAAKGFRWKIDNGKCYVKVEPCKMVEDCLSPDVNEITLSITSEDGEVKFVNPSLKNFKNLAFQFSIDTVPCMDRRPSSGA